MSYDAMATYHLARFMAGAPDADLAVIRAAWPDCPADGPASREAVRKWLEAHPEVAAAVAKTDPSRPPEPQGRPVTWADSATTGHARAGGDPEGYGSIPREALEAILSALLGYPAKYAPEQCGEWGELVRYLQQKTPDQARIILRAACTAELWDALLNHLHTTDLGNAEAIAILFGDRMRYDHTRRRWFVWNGTVWQPDDTETLERLAAETARRRLAAAASAPDHDTRVRLARWALASENAGRIRAALEIAKSLRPIATKAAMWDADPYLLGCANGVLDLRTQTLYTGRPDLLVSQNTGIEYNPDATCPRWEKFLDEIFRGDRELIAFVQRAVGYSLTGDTSEQCFFLCWGSGENGKSVFLQTLRFVFGDYAYNADFSTFLADHYRRGRDATPDLAALKGARLVTASEVTEGHRLNEARIKNLTGGDTITARPLYSNPISFVPTFKIWLAVNHLPRIVETGRAIWRRVRLIPFLETFGPDRADPKLIETLQAEAPGILAWAVRGCAIWQRDRLGMPAAVKEATETYRLEQDAIGRFLADCCVEDANETVQASALYRAYCAWCEEQGEKAVTATTFGRRIAERYHKTKTRDGVRYSGLRLLV